MKIGILGSGDVGRALGHGFAREGHDVKIGTRDAKSGKLDEWKAQAGARGSVGTLDETAAFGEIVVIALPWSGVKNGLDLAGLAHFANKVVIDATNPLVFTEGAPPGLALGHTDSGGEQIQRWLPDANVVKAFNIVGNGLFYKPQLAGGPPTMFIAGNDAEAKRTVTGILTSFGWETIDSGGIEGARTLEPLCILWVGTALGSGNWHQAFKMLRG